MPWACVNPDTPHIGEPSSSSSIELKAVRLQHIQCVAAESAIHNKPLATKLCTAVKATVSLVHLSHFLNSSWHIFGCLCQQFTSARIPFSLYISVHLYLCLFRHPSSYPFSLYYSSCPYPYPSLLTSQLGQRFRSILQLMLHQSALISVHQVPVPIFGLKSVLLRPIEDRRILGCWGREWLCFQFWAQSLARHSPQAVPWTLRHTHRRMNTIESIIVEVTL